MANEKTLEMILADAESRLQSHELKVSKLREKLAKQDAHKAQILSRVLEAWKAEDGNFASELTRRLDGDLKSDSDRKLFGLPPLPKQEPESAEDQRKKRIDELNKSFVEGM